MRNLSLDQLQTLVAIADLGTLAAAAQALHLAPPTVSLHVSELEERLGMALLLRDRKGARPTPAGLALVEDARRLLRELDEAVARARRVAEGRAGKVRLGTSSGVVVHQLPDVLARLARHSPDMEVELSILGSQQTLERLLAGQLELGIVALPLPPQGELVIQPWREDAMMAWLPAGWTVPDAVTPAWLAERPLVANDGSTQMHRLTAAWFAQAGHHPRARIELNYTEAMKSLVAAGYGAAVLPLERGEDTPLPDGVVVRPLAPPLVRRLGLAHRPPALLDAPTRAVLQLLTPA